MKPHLFYAHHTCTVHKKGFNPPWLYTFYIIKYKFYLLNYMELSAFCLTQVNQVLKLVLINSHYCQDLKRSPVLLQQESCQVWLG